MSKMYQEPVVLSDGIAPFGEKLPYPLVARISGGRRGQIIQLERLGKTFNISLVEIEELYALKVEHTRALTETEKEKSLSPW